MPYSFDDTLEAASSKYGGSSKFFKINEGNNNVFRVLTKGAAFAVQYVNGEYRTLYGREKGDPVRQPDDSDSSRDGRIVVPLRDGKEQKPSIRTLVYILDRNDNRIKTAELPYLVVKQIANLQKNPDYGFEDLPMPYDIRVTYTKKDEKGKAVSPMQSYRVEVKPNSPDLTPDQLAELEAKVAANSPETIVQNKKDNQMEDDMRKGLRLSESELEDTAAEYNAGMRERAIAYAKNTPKEPEIPYPTEDINPEDIPF